MTIGSENTNKKKLLALLEQLAQADVDYYEQDSPSMSDAEYDALRRRVERLCGSNRELLDLWTERFDVGGKTKDGFQKHDHIKPMLSLENVFSEDDFLGFLDRINKYLGLKHSDNLSFFCEPKIDGLSLSLIYKNGKLSMAVTRGNGETGENVLKNAVQISDVIPRLKIPNPPDVIEIRGEVFIEFSAFTNLNETLVKKSIKPFANTRNAAAATLRQLDPSVVADRKLSFFAFSLGYHEGLKFQTHSEFVDWLVAAGFRTNPLNVICDSSADVINYYRRLAKIRPSLNYEIDGLVYKINDLTLQKRLGSGRRAPRWAVAHKFPAEQATTTLESIEIQVGRTGSLTPVGRVTPVKIGGVIVSNVTLHNEDEIARKDIRPGDKVFIQRAGDVIPQIMGVANAPSDDVRSAKYEFPKLCPICGSSTERESVDGIQGARRRCMNALNCPAQIEGRLSHFVSKNGLDIQGFGVRQIKGFMERGLIFWPSDIFLIESRIAESALDPLDEWEGFGETSAKNLYQAIENSKHTRIDQVLAALGIRHIGKTNAQLIAKEFQTWAVLANVIEALNIDPNEKKESLVNTLSSIDGIGEVHALAFVEHFLVSEHYAEIKRLGNLLHIEGIPKTRTNHPLSGKRIVFTGTLVNIKRNEAKGRAESLGAMVSSSLSRRTDFLIVGENAGSKKANAESLGVLILDETRFIELLDQ